MSVQLSLALCLKAPPRSFTNYVPGANSSVAQAMQRVIQRQGQNSLYLCGKTGTGKTHLLQAACQEVSQQGGTPAYLPLTDIRQYSIEALEGLESLDLVCLDDVQSIAGMKDWEQALFTLFNQLHESHTPLLISGNTVPLELRLRLKDLVSRLTWGGVFPLRPLEEADQRRVLREHAAALGLQVPEGVVSYLLRQCGDDLKSLVYWLEYLDQASLAAKRRITLPFVRGLWKEQVVSGF